MLPTESRIKELRERFGVWDGQYWAYYKYKNLNWYYLKYNGEIDLSALDNGEWFNFGDIREEDVTRLAGLLEPGEVLVLGWKELGADVRTDRFFGNGGDIWLVITTGGVRYDVMKHREKLTNGG